MNNKVDPAELFKKYPHIAKKITSLWGSAECRELLMSLINDSRGGDREGFSPEIARIIFALLDKHDAIYPQFDKSAHIEVPFGFTRKNRPVGTPVKVQKEGWGIVQYVLIIFFILLCVFAYKAYFLYYAIQ
jgi:hypothetical protein